MQHSVEADFSPSYSNGFQGQFELQEKVRNIEIVLDRSGEFGDGVYFPGETLTGHVRLELARTLPVNNIDLLVQGTGNVAWKTRTPQGEQLLDDDEVYLNEIAELLGRREDELVTLSAGEHLFPFACDLPFNLPASFKGTNGSVSYIVKVILRTDRNEEAQKEPCIASCVFQVQGSLPLNNYTELLNLIELKHKISVQSSSFTLSSNHIRVCLVLPRRVFDTDDVATASVELINSSRRRVLNTGLGLVMESTYSAKSKTYSERMVVVNKEDDTVVRPNEKRKWEDISLKVPRHIPPSDLPYSNIIGIKYWLVFKAEVERSSTKVLLQTPVVIGASMPPELKAERLKAVGDIPTLESHSSKPSQQRVLYHGTQEPPISSFELQTNARRASEPLKVDVDYGRQSSYFPVQPVTPRSERPAPQRFHSTDHTDSQVITMRFTDELDEPHSPYEHSQVSRNPLFTDDDSPADRFQPVNRHSNYNTRVLQSELGPGLSNGHQQEVLY